MDLVLFHTAELMFKEKNSLLAVNIQTLFLNGEE